MVRSWVSRLRPASNSALKHARAVPAANNRKRGWRRLGLFWLAIVSVMGIGCGVLAWLGPPEAPAAREASRKPDARPEVLASVARPLPVEGAGRDTPGPVADPDPALLEPLPPADELTGSLPRLAADGRAARNLYAAGFDHSSRRPRVSVLLAGIGPNAAESDAAIRDLPGAISLIVSPYATNLTKLLATARTAGHEYLIALPLEPTGFPLNDPGPFTLLTSGSVPENLKKLHWALSRADGYVGAAGIIATMRGERLSAVSDQMDAVLGELADRGLMYVDAREGRGPISRAWGSHVDLVVDDPLDQEVADQSMIDAKLAALEQRARDTGSALGIVMRPTPVAVARVAAWTNGLGDRGLALAPASALALAPVNARVKVSERER